MKKIIMSLVMIAACALSGLFVSCDNRDDSKQMAYEAQNNAEVRNIHQHPVEGEFANGIVKFRCIDSFYVDWAGQYFAGTHFCNSQYQILGAETNEAVANLEGCYDVVNREVVGTELSLYFIRDEVEPAYATFRGINDPIDYSRRIAETDTCHYEPFKACFDKTNRRLTVYGIGEHGDTAIAYGNWYGVIVVRDTVRDTLVVHDTINHRDTITVIDTVFIHDSIETINTVQYVVEHLNWNPTVQLINGKLYVTGTDRVTKNVFTNGVLVSTTSVTYNHRSRFRIVGFDNVVFSQSVDDCVAIVNGSAIINGHSFQIIWEADEIVGTVIVGGDNVTSQLVPCHATASQLCATADGHLVIHFVDGSEEVATYTTTYAVEPPTPGEFPNAVYACVIDRYWAAVVSNLSSRETDLVVIEPYGSGYKVLWGEWSATLTRSQCDSITISASDYSWLTGKIAAGYAAVMVPSHSNSSQYFGAVKSEQIGGDDGYWKLTYDIVAGNAYVMSNSAWTLAGYNGRNAQRGVMNASGSITADGITRQLQ